MIYMIIEFGLNIFIQEKRIGRAIFELDKSY